MIEIIERARQLHAGREAIEGVVFPAEKHVKRLLELDVFTHHFGYTENPWLAPPYHSDIAFRLFTRESLPALNSPSSARSSPNEEP